MKNIKRVFIANRGEIAVRIIRACRDLGLDAIQAYSEADRDSLPVRLADASVSIGPPQPSLSYLDARRLIAAAKESGADAVHPGYGFLAESADFASQCEAAGLIFIGPSADVIQLMGDKAAARRLADEKGVPVTKGTLEPLNDVGEAVAVADRIGYPLLIKASAGGGGRGMRVVNNRVELKANFDRAATEATSSFGSGELYIEQYVSPVRHIEVQIMGDGFNVIHIGERDCTIQRRHQKLVEESPSWGLSEELRHRITSSAVSLAASVNYCGAGTVEYIVNLETGYFFFIEMNTRIQVEHPVTEMITGLDLIATQIQIADAGELPVEQSDVEFRGHSIECRINAEDPDKGFFPCPGKITEFRLPSGPGVRVDSHAFPGYVFPAFYDSLIAKLVTWGKQRNDALARMRRALTELDIRGVATTASFHQRLLSTPDFLEGRTDTNYVKDKMWAGHPAQHLL